MSGRVLSARNRRHITPVDKSLESVVDSIDVVASTLQCQSSALSRFLTKRWNSAQPLMAHNGNNARCINNAAVEFAVWRRRNVLQPRALSIAGPAHTHARVRRPHGMVTERQIGSGGRGRGIIFHHRFVPEILMKLKFT